MRFAMCVIFAFTTILARGVEVGDLRAEVETLRLQLLAKEQAVTSIHGAADAALKSKFGPDNTVSTATGKLTIGGLLQTWFYSIQNDNEGIFGPTDNNETRDNDSFRVRRNQLKFLYSLNSHIETVAVIDTSREISSFPGFDSNLGTAHRGPISNKSSVVTNVQNGTGTVGRILTDAYIKFNDYAPYHDFQIGQFKPPLGDEGIRSARDLDFAERAMISQRAAGRDIGATTHGSWQSDRFQYWLGVFNSPANFQSSGGQFSDRTDDNDDKAVLYRVLSRPVWKEDKWGSLELGMSSMFGHHGESGHPASPLNDLNRERNWAIRHYAWASYLPAGPTRGLWLRGEWAWIKDRNIPGSVRNFPDEDTEEEDLDLKQTTPNPFSVSGFYVSAGYNIGLSLFADRVPKWLRSLEYAIRYQQFGNVTVSDLVRPETRTDVFSSKILTAGFNYYIKGQNAKMQLNYNWVNEPNDNNNFAARGFREVRNNSIIVNFQVGF